MKKALLFIFFPLLVSAQDKNDYHWLLGYDPNIPQNFYGGSHIDFHTAPPAVSFFEIPFDFGANAAVSDKAGQLLFYTNGCKIVNREHKIMPNGEGISPGKTYNDYCDDGGYPSSQGTLILPSPKTGDKYLLFHVRISGFDILKTDLLYSVVDMTLAGGMGDIGPVKNQIAVDDSLSDMLTAVRHGNGRDWWIIIPENISNGYYTLLLHPDGISGPFLQYAGTPWTYKNWSGQVAFSPDGNWYARANPYNELHLFRFDRCTGLLSDPHKIALPDPDLFACGVAFSPNSQRLYVSTGLLLYQFDLAQPDVEASRVVVGEYDGFTVTGLPSTFFQMMPAPNGKIYMTCTSTVNVLHVIHSPDSLGLTCDFRQHDLLLPTRSHWKTPNFPHFRLYDLPGSPCDTLGIDGPVAAGEPAGRGTATITVWPNPAQETCTVQVLGGSGVSGRWGLYDSAGRQVQQGEWPVGQKTQQISTHDLAPGAYYFVLRTEGGAVAAQKLMVLR